MMLRRSFLALASAPLVTLGCRININSKPSPTMAEWLDTLPPVSDIYQALRETGPIVCGGLILCATDHHPLKNGVRHSEVVLFYVRVPTGQQIQGVLQIEPMYPRRKQAGKPLFREVQFPPRHIAHNGDWCRLTDESLSYDTGIPRACEVPVPALV